MTFVSPFIFLTCIFATVPCWSSCFYSPFLPLLLPAAKRSFKNINQIVTLLCSDPTKVFHTSQMKAKPHLTAALQAAGCVNSPAVSCPPSAPAATWTSLLFFTHPLQHQSLCTCCSLFSAGNALPPEIGVSTPPFFTAALQRGLT